ncbi:hypothetical protein [Rhizobium sp. Root1220]|uniref:hypothetical protein n=1 Tax=Rhizobium sp. Root1220 TaxID=1736432 RepID=UPI0006F513E8|nr:hypothetical protein [Rhizobium sp. Root1220]KQV70352.1 hypothetical protein ASC90_09585 [Rhizobium sp. Root1220]
MLLFKKKKPYPTAGWLRDDNGRAYASYGRFMLTVEGADEQWFYRVSDTKGELPPVDSKTFPGEGNALNAAQAELDDSADALRPRPEY